MSNLRQAAQQALEALERVNASPHLQDLHNAFHEEITALRAALAEPERKPMTDQQIEALDNLPSYPSDAEVIAFARRIEQAHGIK